MAIYHYIDTSLPEIARTRVKSLTNRVPDQFPVLVFGDQRDHNFVFHYAGVVEPFSGNPAYTLRVTIGNVKLPPESGSYVLTCGTSATLNCFSDAETIQDTLNALTGIVFAGGVKVIGSFPDFIVTWNNPGVVTAITCDPALLVPQSSVSITTTQVGSVSTVNQVSIQLRQVAVSSQSIWSEITNPNGWTGTINTNTASALLHPQTRRNYR